VKRWRFIHLSAVKKTHFRYNDPINVFHTHSSTTLPPSVAYPGNMAGISNGRITPNQRQPPASFLP
jgi:hypothetical protein